MGRLLFRPQHGRDQAGEKEEGARRDARQAGGGGGRPRPVGVGGAAADGPPPAAGQPHDQALLAVDGQDALDGQRPAAERVRRIEDRDHLGQALNDRGTLPGLATWPWPPPSPTASCTTARSST